MSILPLPEQQLDFSKNLSGIWTPQHAGAFGDGSFHEIGDYYKDIDLARERFPHTPDSTHTKDWRETQVDWLATQKLLDFLGLDPTVGWGAAARAPKGQLHFVGSYIFDHPLSIRGAWAPLVTGAGMGASRITFHGDMDDGLLIEGVGFGCFRDFSIAATHGSRIRSGINSLWTYSVEVPVKWPDIPVGESATVVVPVSKAKVGDYANVFNNTYGSGLLAKDFSSSVRRNGFIEVTLTNPFDKTLLLPPEGTLTVGAGSKRTTTCIEIVDVRVADGLFETCVSVGGYDNHGTTQVDHHYLRVYLGGDYDSRYHDRGYNQHGILLGASPPAAAIPGNSLAHDIHRLSPVHCRVALMIRGSSANVWGGAPAACGTVFDLGTLTGPFTATGLRSEQERRALEMYSGTTFLSIKLDRCTFHPQQAPDDGGGITYPIQLSGAGDVELAGVAIHLVKSGLKPMLRLVGQGGGLNVKGSLTMATPLKEAISAYGPVSWDFSPYVETHESSVVKSVIGHATSQPSKDVSSLPENALRAEAPWNIGRLRAGRAVSFNLRVPGARRGDKVVESLTHLLPVGVISFSSIISANMARVTLLNHSGKDADIGAGIVRVEVGEWG